MNKLFDFYMKIPLERKTKAENFIGDGGQGGQALLAWVFREHPNPDASYGVQERTRIIKKAELLKKAG